MFSGKLQLVRTVYGTPSRCKYSNLYVTVRDQVQNSIYINSPACVVAVIHLIDASSLVSFKLQIDSDTYPNGNGSLCYYCSKRRLDYQVADQVPRVFPWACRRDSPSPKIVRSPGNTELVV
jgi:hypothetical protein